MILLILFKQCKKEIYQIFDHGIDRYAFQSAIGPECMIYHYGKQYLRGKYHRKCNAKLYDVNLGDKDIYGFIATGCNEGD